jgi:hypothetical protein
MRAELPDLPEIIKAGFGLTDALAIWSRFQNQPELTPQEARAVLISWNRSQSAELQHSPKSSPNVIQFFPRCAR